MQERFFVIARGGRSGCNARAAFQHADCRCPQALLRASSCLGGKGRVQTLAVEARYVSTPDVHRLLDGAAALLPHLVSLSVSTAACDSHFLPPPPGLALGRHAELPVPVFAPLLRLSSLTRLSWGFANVSTCALQAAIDTAARMAPLISLSLSCDAVVVPAAGEDRPTLDLAPLASLRHLEELCMHECAMGDCSLGEPRAHARATMYASAMMTTHDTSRATYLPTKTCDVVVASVSPVVHSGHVALRRLPRAL